MMKTKNLFYLFLTSIILLTGFSSCNDSTHQLYIGYTTAYTKLGETSSVLIQSGNGGYQIQVGNESILAATVNNNVITLEPKAYGQTTLTVTDSDEQQLQLTIHVIDPYLAFLVGEINTQFAGGDATTQREIMDDVEKTMILKEGNLYDLSRTAAQSFTAYKGWWSSTSESSGTYSIANDSLKLMASGSEIEYAFEKDSEIAKIFYDYFASAKNYEILPENQVFELKADLTEKYKEKYPDKGIESVQVTAPVLFISHRIH